MNEKKQSASWNIAATHFLTSGLAIPFILNIIFALVLVLVFGKDFIENNATLVVFISILYMIAVTWFSVMYSARYVNKKYIIKDNNEVAKLATLYFVVILGGFRIFNLINLPSVTTIEYVGVTGLIFDVIVFYIASKKYLHSSNVSVPQPNV